MHGQEHDAHVGHFLAQERQGLDAIEARHRDIGDDDIGPQAVGGVDHRGAVIDNIHQVELRGE